MRERGAALYISSLNRRNYEHATVQYNQITVPTNHITVLRVLAGKDLHEGMILILFRSSFHVSLLVHIVYCPW